MGANPRRKPLIVYGARQVGKTYLIKNPFASNYYKNKTVYINFKFDDEIRNFINGEGNYATPTSNAQKIIDYISLRLNTPIDKKTLLVFDEIQEALAAITSLKDFKENNPDIRVVASGSLVRIKMKRTGKRSKTKFLIRQNPKEILLPGGDRFFRK